MLFTFNNIKYHLGTNERRTITISGSANEGHVLIVRGPSGSGKSTLLRILARLQPCSGGIVLLKNMNWLDILPTSWRTRVHYLSQKPAIFNGTVGENLAKPFEIQAIKAKASFDMSRAKNILNSLLLPTSLWDQDARTLSGGEAARLAFARALLINPEVLLLDEPTSALDEKTRAAFYQLLSQWLSEPGHTALLVSHNNDYDMLKDIYHIDIVTEREI